MVEQLLQELPKLKSFATLSPIPGFSDWLGKLDAKAVQGILRDGKGRERDGGHDGQRWVAHLSRAAAGKAPEARRAGFRLAAHYLQSMKNGAPLDAVARFHWQRRSHRAPELGRGHLGQGPEAVLRADGELPVRAGRAG